MSEASILDVCIVGCGDRGDAHGRAWADHPGTRVVAVADADLERAKSLSEITGGQAFADWRDAISGPGIDIVSQCVPSSLHAEVACFAAERGCHVFAEKPLALTLEQGERIVNTVRQTGVQFMPCFQYRDRWVSKRFRDSFRSGLLGSPVVLRQSSVGRVRPKIAMHRRSMNGGPVIDMACHYVDLLRWVTGTEPRQVFASGHTFGAGKAHLEGVDDLAIDEACVEVTYAEGHQLQLFLNWGMPEDFGGYGDGFIVGPDGMLRETKGGLEERLAGETREIAQPSEGDPGLRVRVERFVKTLETETPPDITCDDGMVTLRVSLAALQSIESGAVISL